MNLIKLTGALDNKPVWVDMDQIALIAHSDNGGTSLHTVALNLGLEVTETPDEVLKLAGHKQIITFN